MAVTRIEASHMADTYRSKPVDSHGKMRILYAQLNQGAAAGDAGSVWVIGKLPPGPVRVIPHLCRYRVDALGAARVMALGHDKYVSRGDEARTQEPLNASAFGAAIDVSAAVAANMNTTTQNDDGGMAYDMWSAGGITLIATVTGGTIPANATGEFIIVFVDIN